MHDDNDDIACAPALSDAFSRDGTGLRDGNDATAHPSALGADPHTAGRPAHRSGVEWVRRGGWLPAAADLP